MIHPPGYHHRKGAARREGGAERCGLFTRQAFGEASTNKQHKWGERYMAGKQKPKALAADNPLPMLKTVEQMSRISGLGENKLRELMDEGELSISPTATAAS